MTPAAALTQAAMDVTPAYAAEGDENEPIELTNSATIDTAVSKPEGATEEPGWSDVKVKLPTETEFTYDGTNQIGSEKGNVEITVKRTYYTEATGTTPQHKWYKVAADNIVAGYTEGGEDAATAVRNGDAGTYTATYTVNNSGVTEAAPKAGVDFVIAHLGETPQSKNTQDFTINKATATVNLVEGIVGVDSPGSLKNNANSKVTATPEITEPAPTITYYNTNNSDVSLTGGVTGDAAKYVTEGRAKVTVAVANVDAGNYKFMVGGNELTGGVSEEGTTTFTTDVAIKNASKYDVTLTSQTDPGTINAVDNGKALEAPYTGASLKATIESAIGVKAGDKEVEETLVYLDAAGQAMVDGQGNQEYPTMPGKYQVQVKVGDQVVQTVPLTVYVDLTSMVETKADNESNVMNVTIDGRMTDEVKLAFKDNIAFADVKSQIEGGAVATLKKGDTTVPVDFAETFEVIDGTLATTAGAAGTAYIKPLSSNGVYRGQLPVKYTYGTLLPKASLKNASEPYNGPAGGANGYKVEELVSVAKDVNGNTLSPDGPTAGYTVTATRTVDGEPEVKTGDDFITEVGTYTVVVEGAGSYVGESEEMTFTITPLTLKFGANGNATVTYADLATPASGGFSATYTGSQIKPTPTVTATVNGQQLTLKPQNPGNKQAAYDYTVAYGDNTTVAEGGTVDLAFSGNYAYDGTYSQAFAITPASLADVHAKATAASQLKSEFDNTVEGLTVELPGGTVLEEGVDYTVSAPAKASSQAGVPTGCTKYEFTVTGKGNYSDSATGILKSSFLVTDKSIEGLYDVVVEEGSLYNPNGKAEPDVTLYTKGTKSDVTDSAPVNVTYENNVNATTEDAPAYAVITGTGQYAGSVKVPFQIAPLELSDASNVKGSVKLDGAEGLVYNGKEQTPQVLVKGSSITPVNKDYEGGPIALSQAIDQLDVKSEGGVDAGTSYMVIAPKTGNFTGQVKVPYEITKADVAKATIEPAAVVPGADLADAVKVVYEGMELVPGTDYTVAAEGALPGKVTATVAGAGKNFTGTATEDIEVLYDLSGVTFEVAQTTYNGKAQAPVVTAAYYMDGGKKVPVDASAYDVKAGSYVNAGTYPIAIAGDAAAGWTGEKTVDFVIKPATVTAKPQVSYAGGLPVVTVPGLSSSDFDWKADAATKTITVTYKGNYAGTAKVAYTPAVAPGDPGSAQPAAGKTGWVGSGNDWAYYEDGQAVKGGWELIGGEWYHFEKSGKMTNTKWFQDADGTWYMLNQSHKGEYGAMLTGWQKDGGDWYYFAKSGAMQSGWAKVDGEWYLLNAKHDGTFGKMLTGWQQVGGKWYYMDASGEMASNEWVGRYWVNGSGVWTATR